MSDTHTELETEDEWDSISVFCCFSVAKSCRLFLTPWTAAHQASLSFSISQSLLKLMSVESVVPSNHLILCHLLLLVASIFSIIKVFSNELALHIRWPKYWSCSISPSNEYSGLISFRIDWFNLLAVRGTVKSLLQHRNLKASVLQHSASLWSNSHICTELLENQSFDSLALCQLSDVSAF